VIGMMTKIFGGWLVAILSGFPLYAAMALAALAFIVSAGMPLTILPQRMAGSINSFPLIAAPLFILMGNIMNSAGVTDRIFAFATACVGWLRGGLCHANILASVIFAGMSGSAVADAGGVGTLEIKAMKDEGYDPETAAAITAASATIGPIIPPSLPMVIYGVSADVSIGGLFLAGALIMVYNLIMTVRAAPNALEKGLAPAAGLQPAE
jgi:tripartite ATP-independent transporter DctM subunit